MMSQSMVVPRPGPAGDKAEVSAAYEAFLSAGFRLRRDFGSWWVRKLVGGQDRWLSDAELMFLARSLRRGCEAAE